MTSARCLQTIETGQPKILCVAVLPCDLVITGCVDHIKLWDTTGRCVNALTNVGPVYSLAIMPDNRVGAGCKGELVVGPGR